MTKPTEPSAHIMREDSQVVYQPARADQADRAADLFWSSGYEIFGYNYFGEEPFSRLVKQSWVASDALFNHKHTNAAYFNDQLIGIEMGFTSETIEQRVPGHLEAKAQVFSDEENRISDLRWPQIAPMVPDAPPDTYYLSNLAVSPEAQGRKVGYKLLTNAFTRAKQNGFNWVMLDVCHRKPAVRFYEQVGMIRLVETRLPQLEQPYDVPMHIRMGMNLKNWPAPQNQG